MGRPGQRRQATTRPARDTAYQRTDPVTAPSPASVTGNQAVRINSRSFTAKVRSMRTERTV